MRENWEGIEVRRHNESEFMCVLEYRNRERKRKRKSS